MNNKAEIIMCEVTCAQNIAINFIRPKEIKGEEKESPKCPALDVLGQPIVFCLLSHRHYDIADIPKVHLYNKAERMHGEFVA
jgi:hypothetical protein